MSTPHMNLDAVFGALREQPAKSRGGGRAIMFVSARSGENVTGVAHAAAQGAGAGNVYAIDLDLRRNALGRSFAITGKLGPKIDGRLGGFSFCSAVDAHGVKLPAQFCYHRVGESRLLVGAFDGRGLPKTARLVVQASADYWNAARASGATVIVDAPALEKSQVGLRVAPHMDGVVLVVSEADGAAPAAKAAREAILNAGGNLIGLVYTNASTPAVVMDKLLRQAS